MTTLPNNKPTKRFIPLSRSLVLWFLVLSLLPLIIVSWISYQQANTSLSKIVAEELEQSASLSSRFIHNWFNYRLIDLNTQSETKSNVQLLATLAEGFNKSSKPLAEYVKSYDWAQRVDSVKNDLVTMSRRYDYIYDLFLIDLQGNLLFSIVHENDLGTNLFTGTYANTLFARNVKITLETGRSMFSDLERYAPSNNIIAGFLTAPILDENGNKLGVFAIQIRIEKIISSLQKTLMNQNTLVHYLVGEDGRLRSPIHDNEYEVLRRVINTEQFRHWQGEFDEFDYVHNDGYNGVFSYLGPDGKQVIGVHQTLRILGNNWLLISEIDKDEALAPAYWLGMVTLGLVLITMITVSIVAIYLARRITRPIIQLADNSMLVAAGETNQFVEIEDNNEIGRLANAFNHMLQMRSMHEQTLEKTTQRAQIALSELSEQKFAMDQHSIISVTDVQGNITFSNNKFSEISGYSRDELIGKNHRILNSGVHDKEFFRDMYRAITRGKVWHNEVCNKAKNSHLYWVDATIVPFLGKDGKPESYIAIRTDITERKRSELELIKAKDDAELGARTKSEFLASMSHEIRTPMNGVLGMLDLLLNSKLDKAQHYKVSVAQNSARSLLSLINDILDFSKIDAGKLELEILDFNLRTMLGEFADAMAHQAQAKNLELVLDVTGVEQSMVKGDPGRLRQIITNLVGNAIKFTSEGEIVVRVDLQEVEGGKLRLRCAVSDTGIGIPAEKLSALFDCFSQVDASTTRKYGGTGLGLSIAKCLSEMMGGGISVSSELGKGSCFEINLLLEKSEQSQLVMPKVDVSVLNILIVDDNATNREVLCGQLQHWNASVVEAESGKQALQVCEQRAQQTDLAFFDIALLDMQMPDMDGEQLGKVLKADSRFTNMKLVMMTSMGYQGEAQYFADIGFSAYFPKPVNTSDLFSALAVVADGGEALQQAAPLVTHHYLKTLTQKKESAIENGDSIMNDNPWPENTRILLVEDNQVNQLVATGILNNLGVLSDIASNGLEAIQSLKASAEMPYTLILMDCQMPEMDGYGATGAIRQGDAGEQYKTIPIIAMTANAMEGDREKCLQAGMSDYLSKPVDPEKIFKKLCEWISTNITGNENAPVSEQDKNTAIDTEEDVPVVWDKDDALKRLMGKETLLNKIIDVFFNETPDRMQQLQNAINNNDCEQACHLAHTLKGMGGNLSGLRVQKQAALMEIAAKEKAIDDLEKLMPSLIEAIEELTECFKSS